jgi:microcystin-dependent protein
MESFLASIILFAGNFAPRGWAFCQGQILPIAQNTALFSLLGTTYGGNGQTTFALPDLRGRAPIGQGQGPGLPPVQLGEAAGSPSTTLNISNMPQHNHQLNCGGSADAFAPGGNFMASESNQQTQVYGGGAVAGQMNAQSIGVAGSSQPFSNMQPYLGLNYIICMEGIFPSRN